MWWGNNLKNNCLNDNDCTNYPNRGNNNTIYAIFKE